MSRQPFALAFILALTALPAAAWDDEGRRNCAPCRSESFGHGYDPFDDGTEAWFAPNVGSWPDHADAYYGYGECRFLREPILGQRGEVVDYRRVRVCN
ncbi:MAG: hypothetical protein FJX40_11495 [Alphaproteobacteria bacterium]|nr:hypothetical protein [Alphaproteobacteria bacterium]MBM3642091.1 hypothetical protein [Alphaproteobacteria bacterium]